MIDGFKVGIFYFHFYGIVIMFGAVMGALLATHEAKRRGNDPGIVWDLLIYLIVGSIIGARLWHIFTPSPSAIQNGRTTAFYFLHPLEALAVWKGGLGIVGAVIGGIVVLFFYSRKHGLNFAEWADIAVPGLALGQAIGRWGNFFNQELYGAPTTLPWKLYIDSAHRLLGFENFEFYHPLFAYEAILSLINMFFLLWVGRRFADRLIRGDLLLMYLIFYPTIRFFLEFLRLDSSQVAGVNANQTFMVFVAFCAVVSLVWRHRKNT